MAKTTKLITALTTLDTITIFLIKIWDGFRRHRRPIDVDISMLTSRFCPVLLLLRTFMNLRYVYVLSSVLRSEVSR